MNEIHKFEVGDIVVLKRNYISVIHNTAYYKGSRFRVTKLFGSRFISVKPLSGARDLIGISYRYFKLEERSDLKLFRGFLYE